MFRGLFIFLSFMLALAEGPTLHAQPSALQYQKRGTYSEGTRTIPSTGKATLDLIAVLADQPEAHDGLPPMFRVAFFVPASEQAVLSVRELDPVYFYQLGDVDSAAWSGPKLIQFEWPTQTVVAKLTYRKRPLGLDQLGAVVRIGAVAPSTTETVAPVALYHSRLPDRVSSYRFVFVPTQRSKLEFRIKPEKEESVMASEIFDSSLAKQPTTFVWEPDASPEGWYRLEVTGYVLRNNDRLNNIVRFYHRSELLSNQ